eukprot:355604-Chlamydomonas_euryale.AAC.10
MWYTHAPCSTRVAASPQIGGRSPAAAPLTDRPRIANRGASRLRQKTLLGRSAAAAHDLDARSRSHSHICAVRPASVEPRCT